MGGAIMSLTKLENLKKQVHLGNCISVLDKQSLKLIVKLIYQKATAPTIPPKGVSKCSYDLRSSVGSHKSSNH